MHVLSCSGLLLAFATVFLQLAVFLQPLLPEQYQIAPVCEDITQSLLRPSHSHNLHSESQDFSHHHLQDFSKQPESSFIHHYLHADQDEHRSTTGHNHHDMNHQCQYCVVYGNLVMPPEVGVQEILVRIQVKLMAFVEAFQHVYFLLQRLFLIPQGRAPPMVFV